LSAACSLRTPPKVRSTEKATRPDIRSKALVREEPENSFKDMQSACSMFHGVEQAEKTCPCKPLVPNQRELGGS
jgi:hypothetical protein